VYSAVDTLFKSSANSCLNPSCGKFHETIYNCFDASVIGKLIQDCPKQINKMSSQFKLTPLHLATISGNAPAVKSLIENGAAINRRDYKKFTALAHAAMKGDLNLVSVLKEHNAKDLITSTGATSEDYLKLNRLGEKAACSIEQPACASHDAQVAVGQNCLENGVEWINEMVITPQQLVDIWENRAEEPYTIGINFAASFLESIERFRKQQPTLSIEQISVDDRNRPLPFNMCGLVAQSPIKSGEVIAEYVGEWNENQWSLDDTYLFNSVDGIRFRGYAAMSNDGFPNTNAVQVPNSAGLTRSFLFASEDIKPGEQIVWDYGDAHSLKRQGRVEMRSAALVDFFRKEFSNKDWVLNFKNLVNNLRGSQKLSADEQKDTLMRVPKWLYLSTTPASLLILLEEGVINREIVSQLMKIMRVPDEFYKFEEYARTYENLANKDKEQATTYLENLKKKYFI
jgi:hypothetical protein